MQVYIELAVLENFCMDFTLLYAAKAVVKNPVSKKRIAVAAAFGACFAVAFPLFGLDAVWSVVVKIASGGALCFIAGWRKSFKQFLKFSGVFLAFTALLGGALIGIFSLTGLGYSGGGGYILSSVPIGIPMFGGLIIILGAKKLAARLKKSHKDSVTCRIYAGQSQVTVKGFFDSGNKVYSRGAPVCVIDAAVAEKLIGDSRIKEDVKIHTVAGSDTIRIFTADKIEIDFGEKTDTLKGVKMGISPQKIDRAVLHPDLLENIRLAD